MAEYMHLVGAEQVQSAANRISSAADTMSSAASIMDSAAREMRAIADAFSSQLELVLSEHLNRVAELLADDRRKRLPE